MGDTGSAEETLAQDYFCGVAITLICVSSTQMLFHSAPCSLCTLYEPGTQVSFMYLLMHPCSKSWSSTKVQYIHKCVLLTKGQLEVAYIFPLFQLCKG